MISRRALPATAVTVGPLRVTPVAREWRLTWPAGGLAWLRPYEIVAETGGPSKRLRVRDRTRVIQLGLLGAGVVAALLIRWSSGRRRNSKTR